MEWEEFSEEARSAREEQKKARELKSPTISYDPRDRESMITALTSMVRQMRHIKERTKIIDAEIEQVRAKSVFSSGS